MFDITQGLTNEDQCHYFPGIMILFKDSAPTVNFITTFSSAFTP